MKFLERSSNLNAPTGHGHGQNLNNKHGHRVQPELEHRTHQLDNPNSALYANEQKAKENEKEKEKHFRLGYQEAMSEAVRFMVQFEGICAGDGLCLRLINHMHQHVAKLEGDFNSIEAGKDIKPVIANGQTIDTRMDTEETDMQKLSRNRLDGSQLRKMLEAKESLQITDQDLTLSSKVTLDTGTVVSPPPASPSIYTEGSRKNYKKEIKDRFQATLAKVGGGSDAMATSSRDPSCDLMGGGKWTALTNLELGNGVDGQLVPGFALHPAGTFYVPVRLEPTSVSRFMTADAQPGPYPLLHPINIAVSFANSSSLFWPPAGQATILGTDPRPTQRTGLGVFG